MGVFRYGTQSFEMEDRVLLHLQIAIHEVFTERQSFYLSWVKSHEQGSGRVSVLMTSGVHVMFEFGGNRLPRVNPQWIALLISTSHRGGGLILLPETAVDGIALKGQPQ